MLAWISSPTLRTNDYNAHLAMNSFHSHLDLVAPVRSGSNSAAESKDSGEKVTTTPGAYGVAL
jgi:2-oxoglutarate dehydrogenase complex dehydrogenase (E1) component-like enzyme